MLYSYSSAFFFASIVNHQHKHPHPHLHHQKYIVTATRTCNPLHTVILALHCGFCRCSVVLLLCYCCYWCWMLLLCAVAGWLMLLHSSMPCYIIWYIENGCIHTSLSFSPSLTNSSFSLDIVVIQCHYNCDNEWSVRKIFALTVGWFASSSSSLALSLSLSLSLSCLSLSHIHRESHKQFLFLPSFSYARKSFTLCSSLFMELRARAAIQTARRRQLS